MVRDGEPPIVRVHVQLRCGFLSDHSWPVDTGRRETTNWALTGSPFDIEFWRPA